MTVNAAYKIVKLAGGATSVHSVAEGETFHPVIGPEAEAEALYVRQTGLAERFKTSEQPFVIWDVGLGSAANCCGLLKALENIPGTLNIISFDRTIDPLTFALSNAAQLAYMSGFENILSCLASDKKISTKHGGLHLEWAAHIADFPTLIASAAARQLPKPHVILFDAFSPARNPEMWTLPLFRNLFDLMDPARPCVMPTYSRSTLLRVTLLLAGFFVGAGHATGEKDETTIASNSPELINEPLGARWLQRAKRSTSAEPLYEKEYLQAPLREETWRLLQAHPQFQGEQKDL